MRVLFVSSGNKRNGISPLVLNQGESLRKNGVCVVYFMIKGKGVTGYLSQRSELRKTVKKEGIDLIHAHYSLSGMLSTFSMTGRPIVVSLMGSDVYAAFFWKILVRLFSYYSWKAVIVKTEAMKKKIRLHNLHVIPNGINMETFKPLDPLESKKKSGFDSKTKHILFLADPARKEKNFPLAKQACHLLLKQTSSKLHVIFEKPQSDIPVLLCAADVLLCTSKHEGSPNVIKEAMACNCPVVTTNVGDVDRLTGEITGCYIANHDPEEIASYLFKAIHLGKRTNGREQILKLGLDENSVSSCIIKVYEEIITGS